ncbi:MAG TPA: hypothetical protein VHA56_09145 [Mucilaginibacter sp.]|nr:hypothetical protein [Mucilaginibacter sp.]
MKEQESYEPVLPVEFSHLEGDLKTAREKISNIDNQLGQLPPDRGYRPGLRPKNYGDPAGNQRELRSQLENQKNEVRKEFDEKLEPQLSNADPKLAAKVRNSVNVHLGDNAFKDMNQKQLNDVKGEAKSMDYSQEFLNKRLSNYHAAINRNEGRLPTEPGVSTSKVRDVDMGKD